MTDAENALYLFLKLGMLKSHEMLAASPGRYKQHLEAIKELLAAELSQRQYRSELVRLKLSRLPFRKTLEEFDFRFQPELEEGKVRKLAGSTSLIRRRMCSFWAPRA